MVAASGLNVADVVRVDVTLSPLAVPVRNFGVPLLIGASEVIDVAERQRQYTSLDEVSEDFTTDTDEYKAAAIFFGQNPQPALCFIGRWAQTDTAAILYGGVLTPADQLLSNFTGITSGAMFLYVNGVPKNITGMNFAAQTTLNGVANVLQTQWRAFSGDATGTVTWLPGSNRFKLAKADVGADSTLSWAQGPTAWGSVAFSKQPADQDIIAIGGGSIKFVSSNPGTDEVLIGANTWETIENFLTVAGQSSNVNVQKAIYSAVPGLTNATGTIYVVAAASGVTGNDITLEDTVDSGAAMTLGNLAGGKLNGGSGQDVSSAFRLSSARSAPAPVAGTTAETPVAALQIHADLSHAWYAAMIVTNTQPTLQQHEAVAQAIEAMSPARIYCLTSGDSNVVDPLTVADIAGSMHTLNLARTFGQYSTTAPDNAVVSLFGRFANVDFRQNNSVITGKFKREPGVVAEILTETQAATLKAKCMNVFAQYDVDVAIIQEAQMFNGDFIDERIGLDWFQNALQLALWNLLYTSPTKIPQTDAGTSLLINACKVICQQAVFNGLVASGQWTGPAVGQLNTGDILPTGFYVFAPPVASQSQADREARKSVPLQIALKLAGAVHSVVCSVWVNR